jgi:hypothetical protein
MAYYTIAYKIGNSYLNSGDILLNSPFKHFISFRKDAIVSCTVISWLCRWQ